MDVNWYVLKCTPQKEIEAAAAIRWFGHDAVVPTELRLRRECRHRRARTTYSVVRFPGYVFAGVPADLSPWIVVNDVRPVTGILGRHGQPSVLPPEGVQWVMANREPVSAIPVCRKFRPGDKIKVAGGPLQGRTATITKISHRGAYITEHFFGAFREIKVPVMLLEAA